ncbi:ABC transporter substrate-binding protein [Fulvimarina sp. 2208YS6-2-32]|uniref:ABC transporter substrate-binding protein n=1 Tax=Fulvimarina uroteuthidis TaxID=3098149 RepID=A0ABU5I106_9HYPH|nr:ABC transporter substrate-binding protein [Fulvimarina sp. 2208YS6-2-32]MDY8108896.1 ABC transporter substrate-binding protein [Fulvimarina sp. 2208YS6-2-32]
MASPLVCAGIRPVDARDASASSFPMTIEHVFGTTVIEEKPERIAAVSWGNHEVPLALGIVPVGMARAGFGDDDGDGVLPWVEARLEELGAATPVLFDETDGIDYEAVASTRPDVILAAYSGLSRNDYETLSQIAPVVAYPASASAWTTPWREMIRLDSAGMGMVDEGAALIASIEAEIARSVARHPRIEGRSAMFVTHLDATNLSTINFYTAQDTRVRFFEDLGLTSPRAVEAASRSGQYSGSVSAERIDDFDDVDIIVTYGGDALRTAIESNPLLSKMPAVANGGLVLLGDDPVATGANPTPLSIGWVLDDYLALLEDAAGASR